jgi:hypothetical protein
LFLAALKQTTDHQHRGVNAKKIIKIAFRGMHAHDRHRNRQPEEQFGLHVPYPPPDEYRLPNAIVPAAENMSTSASALKSKIKQPI